MGPEGECLHCPWTLSAILVQVTLAFLFSCLAGLTWWSPRRHLPFLSRLMAASAIILSFAIVAGVSLFGIDWPWVEVLKKRVWDWYLLLAWAVLNLGLAITCSLIGKRHARNGSARATGPA